MAFDMGFNFRDTVGYVTDPAYAVFVKNTHTYPTLYTNGNGFSVNAGWDSTTDVNAFDLNAGNDPRIAGINYIDNAGTVKTFHVDLSSGSAPGAGTYTVDLAVGATIAVTADFKLLDNATVVLDGTNGGSGYNTAGNHYRDATLTDRTATTTWNGVTISQAFASTTVILGGGYDAGAPSLTCFAHFRLALAVVAAAAIPRQLMPPMRPT